MADVKVTWLGHGSMMASWDNKVVFMDPFFGNPNCKMKMEDVKTATAVLVTHGHNDHIGNSFEICKKTGATLICSPEIGIYADSKGIKWDIGSYPMNAGGSWRGDGFTVYVTQAQHSSDILGEEYDKSGTILPGSGCYGYVLDIDGGATIYFSGDTDVFGDMAIIRELYAPNVGIVSCGGRFTMTYAGGALAASLLGVDYFIPMHFNTFAFNQLDRDKLESAMKVRAPHCKLVRIEPMQSFTCPVCSCKG
ncbi:MAG: metal-dependent hydrolase [Candidatus Latescibacterota bacterium]